MRLKGRRRWGCNKRWSGIRGDNRRRRRRRNRGSRPTAGSQYGRDAGSIILSKSQSLYGLWRSRRGRHTGTRARPGSTSVLLDYGFLQVSNFGNVAASHPHVDHRSSLTLRNLALGLAFLLCDRWRQQAVIVLDKVHKQRLGRRLSEPSGAERHQAHQSRAGLERTSHSRVSASRSLFR